MSTYKHEEWSPQQALAISLYSLYDQGVIAIKADENGNKRLEVISDPAAPLELRDYELDLVAAISDNCLSSFFETMNNFLFNDWLMVNGYFQKVKLYFFYIFPFEKIVLTSLGEQELGKLVQEKADLFFFSQKRHLLPLRASIYPSLPDRSELLLYFQEVVAEIAKLILKDKLEEARSRELLSEEILLTI